MSRNSSTIESWHLCYLRHLSAGVRVAAQEVWLRIAPVPLCNQRSVRGNPNKDQIKQKKAFEPEDILDL
jgi:hypothetical protein